MIALEQLAISKDIGAKVSGREHPGAAVRIGRGVVNIALQERTIGAGFAGAGSICTMISPSFTGSISLNGAIFIAFWLTAKGATAPAAARDFFPSPVNNSRLRDLVPARRLNSRILQNHIRSRRMRGLLDGLPFAVACLQ